MQEFLPKRYIFTLLAHFGVFIIYAQRVNVSITFIGIANMTYIGENQNGSTSRFTSNLGTFSWNKDKRGLLLSSFYYGYILTQVLGGFWSIKYGGKWVVGFSILLTSLLSLFIPAAVQTSFYFLLILRFLEGLTQGLTLPALHSLMAMWSPPMERTRIYAYTYSGVYSGIIVPLVISSVFSDSILIGGWPSIFYAFGFLGFIWFFFWSIFIYTTPAEHPTISIKEKDLLMINSNDGGPLDVQIPWLDIFKSVPVWACICGVFCSSWIWYIVFTDLPSYFHEVLAFNMKENALLSVIPFLVGFLATILVGLIADFLLKKYLSIGFTRKLMNCLGCYPTIIFLFLASDTYSNQTKVSTTFMALAVGTLMFSSGGYPVNVIDISKNFTGIIMALCNIVGTIAGFLTPFITSYFINDHPTSREYRKVFAIAASISAISGLFYVTTASGIQQPWDKINDKNHVVSSDLSSTANRDVIYDNGNGNNEHTFLFNLPDVIV